MNSPEGRERIVSAGFVTMTSTPGEFGEFVGNETARWAKVIKASGLQPE